MGIFGWDLPPGCSISDIPGNRPEDGEWEALEENFWDKKRIRNRKYGIRISGKDMRAMNQVYKAKKYDKICGAVEDYIIMAIEYGIEIGKQQQKDVEDENLYYETQYIDEELQKLGVSQDVIYKILSIVHPPKKLEK